MSPPEKPSHLPILPKCLERLEVRVIDRDCLFLDRLKELIWLDLRGVGKSTHPTCAIFRKYRILIPVTDRNEGAKFVRTRDCEMSPKRLRIFGSRLSAD